MLNLKYLMMVFMFFASVASRAEEDELQYNQEFREDYKKDYKDEDFQYIEQEKEPEEIEFDVDEPIEDYSGFVDFLIILVKILGYAAIGTVVFLVVRAVLLQGDLKLFKKSKVQENTVQEVKDEEQIENLDWIQLALKAKSDQELKLAVRYYFLAFLKTLSQQKQIVFHPEKSNREYYYEIQEKGSKDAFQTLSRVYDYCWYGDFDINQEQFQKAESIFKSYLK